MSIAEWGLIGGVIPLCLGANVARLPDCGTPMAEIQGECMRFRLP